MNVNGQLIPAVFIDRPNRFITTVRINEEIHSSHLPDPGRLRELLIPGVQLLVRPESSPKRKTSFTTVMVRHKGILISLVSTLPNQFIKHALESSSIPFLRKYNLVRPEIALGKHRIDFLLTNSKNKNFFLEVKSVTYVEDNIAKFPDAVTKRGMEHVMALEEVVKKGGNAGILFVCQRPDAKVFQPMWARDPRFSKALYYAHQTGVKVWCICLNITKTDITYSKEIPVFLGKSIC